MVDTKLPRYIGLFVGIFVFVFVGAAVWVVLLSGEQNWVGVVFDPAYVIIVLVALGIAGMGYWVGEKMGFGE